MGPGPGAPDPEISIAGGWDPIDAGVDFGGGTGIALAEIVRARNDGMPPTVDMAPQTKLHPAIPAFFGPGEGSCESLFGSDYPSRLISSIV
jgi:hypothetical protein